MTFDLVNKCEFPCCIYGPTWWTLKSQSMWKLEPNVHFNLFLQQTNRQQHQWGQSGGQSDPYVSFLLRQATQIPIFCHKKFIKICILRTIRFCSITPACSPNTCRCMKRIWISISNICNDSTKQLQWQIYCKNWIFLHLMLPILMLILEV